MENIEIKDDNFEELKENLKRLRAAIRELAINQVQLKLERKEYYVGPNKTPNAHMKHVYNRMKIRHMHRSLDQLKGKEIKPWKRAYFNPVLLQKLESEIFVKTKML